jgi:integrase
VAKRIEALKPRATAYELPDGGAPGLRLRVTPLGRDGVGGGSKVFRWQVRSLDRVVTLGPWSMEKREGYLTLGQARAWLERLRDAHRIGQLDQVLGELRREVPLKSPKAAAPASARSSDLVTLGTVAEDFYKRRILPHRKRPEAVRKVLDLDLLPVLGERPLDTLTTRDCATAIERVVDRGAPVHAGKVLAVLKQLCRFAQARGYTDRTPAAVLDPKDLGVVSNVSQRWLTDKEIVLFWRALHVKAPEVTVARHDPRTGKTQSFTQAYGGLLTVTRLGLRALLLTGVRSCELLLARWEDVDLRAATWSIPVANQKLTKDQAKKAKPFVIPLPPLVIGIFKELKKESKKSPWLMASSDAEEGHLTDKALGRAMRRLFDNKTPLLTLPGGPASPHDLRRTMRTHLGRLRVPLHVAERCLNHSLGRIVQTYDGDASYLEERREAMARWAGYVEGLISAKAGKVVVLNTPQSQSSGA